MRRMYVLSVAITLLAAGLLAQGGEYQGWMKSNAANMGSLNKNLADKKRAGAELTAGLLR